MPVTIKSVQMKYKDQYDNYVGVDAVSDFTTEQKLEAINTAGTTQTGAVNSAGETQLAAVNGAGSTQITNINNRAAEIENSWPSDYTELTEDVEDLKSALNVNQNEINTFEDTGRGTLSRGGFERDVYNPSTGATNSYPNRISARSQIVFPYAVSLEIASGFRLYPYKYQNDAWTGQGWQTGTYNLAANTPIYAQISRTTEDSSEVADIQTFLNAVNVVGNPIKGSIDNLDFLTERAITDSLQREELDIFGNIEVEIEQGSWGYSNGLINNPSTSNRLRSKSIFRVKKGDKIVFRGWNVICAAAVFSGIKSGSILQSTGWLNNVASRIESVITINYDGYIYFNFAKGGDPDLTPNDYDGYTYIVNKFAYNLPEKAVHVYQFGGNGNDWCFVRTPENYDPERAKPYPFVICNHGNGWVMDGTIQKANWTKRTMYVPTDDSDYIADPTEYNGTGVAKLQYSNPTIEALLTAGYIVCGCENYGDNLYGNNNCRNACVDFFYHMTSHYNVEDRCYMIGASNGAMTSLNAAYLMQGAVKAMILQYPLTCLVNQYEHPGSSASGHPAAIRAAYGITDADITEAELTKAVATHDPLTVDVVSGVKVGVFPPTKLYYSPNDVVVNCQYNALALATMLDNSNKVVGTVQCSGEHGDHSHFAPDDYVDWFDEN